MLAYRAQVPGSIPSTQWYYTRISLTFTWAPYPRHAFSKMAHISFDDHVAQLGRFSGIMVPFRARIPSSIHTKG